ncbi:cysteine-rich hydrophobic domain-containing protein 2-like [Sycon ciliatum]|uniref:cysteine-rich hydrophobic domain-containing protein 2-like n=1 Tax=Sycon ciliatum TaxID=27933 RepID=UPI0020A9FD64|eukprot:scpid75745/ scgid7169/ Cysteine-rich hydrophobic domain 1 protein; Brain X-linked protein
MADGDPDMIESADEDVDVVLQTTRPAPVVIKGIGNITMFGLTNRFDNDFPPSLIGKVAKEEFNATIDLVNNLIGRAVPRSARWLVAGCLCCCCTAGFSLSPVVYLNKKTQSRIRGVLEAENNRVYQKLGFSWWLEKQKCPASNLKEYVILIETLERLDIHRPD